MMKLVKRLIITLFTLSIVIILITGPLLYLSFNNSFYEKYINKTNFGEIGKEKARSLIQNTLSFLQGGEDLSSEFSNNEKSHMLDVRKLFTLSKILFLIALFIILITVIITYTSLRVSTFLLKPIFYASLITLGLVGLLVISTFFNFNSLFLMFHNIFFPQGNFTFPSNSLLITLFPESFFQTISTNIFLTVIILSIILFVLSYFLLRKKKLSSNN